MMKYIFLYIDLLDRQWASLAIDMEVAHFVCGKPTFSAIATLSRPIKSECIKSQLKLKFEIIIINFLPIK